MVIYDEASACRVEMQYSTADIVEQRRVTFEALALRAGERVLDVGVGPGYLALEMARVFKEVDILIVPSLRDEQLTITNFTGHPSLTLRAGFVEVSEARSDWAPDPENPLPKFDPPRRVPHGITIVGRLFDEGLIGQVGLALERAFGVAEQRPPGF